MALFRQAVPYDNQQYRIYTNEKVKVVLSCWYILSCVELYVTVQQKVTVEDDIDFAISVVSLFSSTSRLVSATNILIYLQHLLFVDSRGFCATLVDRTRLAKYQSHSCTVYVGCCSVDAS